MKLVYLAAALSVMALSPNALAQTTPSKPSTDQPSATQPSTTPPSATQPKTTQPSATGSPQWYSHQAGEMRASKLIGTSVKNDAGETIGDINEIVLAKDGQVAAAVIGVGGFLGIGEREVAVAFESLRLSMDNNQRTVATLAANKEALKSAPEWKWSSAGNSGTTGTGTSPTKPSK